MLRDIRPGRTWAIGAVMGFAALCASSLPANAGLITIDDFTDTDGSGPIEVFTGQTSDGTSETGLSGVLGGNRSTTLSNGQFGSILDRATATVAPSVQGGVLDYSSTLFASSDLTLVYGINAAPFDFSGQSGIIIDFVGFDFPENGPLQITALLTSNGNSQTVTTMVSDSGSGEVLLDFNQLTPLRGVFDLSDVDDVAIEFVAAAASDFRIGTIRTQLPVPGAGLILGLGAISVRRRRRSE